MSTVRCCGRGVPSEPSGVREAVLQEAAVLWSLPPASVLEDALGPQAPRASLVRARGTLCQCRSIGL